MARELFTNWASIQEYFSDTISHVGFGWGSIVQRCLPIHIAGMDITVVPKNHKLNNARICKQES